MKKKGVIAVAFLLVAAIGVAVAVQASRLRPETGIGTSYVLLFSTAWWLVFAAPFAGLLASAFTRRQDPRVEGDRVLRHDGAAILAHWTHALGTTALLVTGIGLGFLFVPRLFENVATAGLFMNLHFVAVVFFLFGTFYWLGNTLLATKRFREHLPTDRAIPFTIQHYGLLLGFKKFEMPPEDKYFESERMAFILALAATGLIVLSGIVKVAAHALALPGAILGVANVTHDVSTLLMLAFFLAHVFFAAIAPFSWPVLGSMFNGYVSLEHAEHEHVGWLGRLGHPVSHRSPARRVPSATPSAAPEPAPAGSATK